MAPRDKPGGITFIARTAGQPKQGKQPHTPEGTAPPKLAKRPHVPEGPVSPGVSRSPPSFTSPALSRGTGSACRTLGRLPWTPGSEAGGIRGRGLWRAIGKTRKTTPYTRKAGRWISGNRNTLKDQNSRVFIRHQQPAMRAYEATGAPALLPSALFNTDGFSLP